MCAVMLYLVDLTLNKPISPPPYLCSEYDVALRSQIYQELFPKVLEILPRFSQDGRDIYSGLEKYADWGESFYARTFLYCLGE